MTSWSRTTLARRQPARREHAPTSQVDSDDVEEGVLMEERSISRKGNVVRKQSSRGLRTECSATRRRAVAVGGGWLRSTTEEAKASDNDRSPRWGMRRTTTERGDREARCWERRVEEGGRVTGGRSGEQRYSFYGHEVTRQTSNGRLLTPRIALISVGALFFTLIFKIKDYFNVMRVVFCDK